MPEPKPRVGTRNRLSPAPIRIIVLTRVPRIGQVKTRLARQIGKTAALAVHRELLASALDSARRAAPASLELCVDGDDDEGECAQLAAAHGATLTTQHGETLGARMHEALSRALRVGERPVLIGSDVPPLGPSDLRAAFAALDGHDAVFAPTEDGGYALVGCRRPIAAAFSAIDWGGASVMAQTRDRLRAAGIGWAELRTLWDVDDVEGWRRWRRLRGAGVDPA